MSSAAVDVVIVGAGPAGLAAAYHTANEGLRVVVVDDNPASGGQIWRGEQRQPSSKEAGEWFERIRRADIQFVHGARVFQANSNTLLAEMAQGVTELSYTNLILATGARERFLPFPGWTLPNVMGAGGLQALVKTGLSIAGKRVVIAGSGPLLLAVAGYLHERGANVLLIAEQARRSRLIRFSLNLLNEKTKRRHAIELKRRLKKTRYLTGCWPVIAHGDEKLASVTLQRGEKRWQVECDYLACGFHLVPNLELAELLECRVENGAVSVDEFQQTSVPRVYAAGEVTGIGGLELSLVEGEIAGLAVAEKREEARKLFSVREKQRRFARILNETFALREELRDLATSETLVCRCEDVSFGRLKAHDSWRSAKLQTRCGMGPCQGRVCGPAVEFLFDWKVESVRPPVFPVRVESMVMNGAKVCK